MAQAAVATVRAVVVVLVKNCDRDENSCHDDRFVDVLPVLVSIVLSSFSGELGCNEDKTVFRHGQITHVCITGKTHI